jgi:hypothetical protein
MYFITKWSATRAERIWSPLGLPCRAIRESLAQLGHTDPKMTLGLYAQTLKSKSRRADRALSGAGEHLSVTEAPG